MTDANHDPIDGQICQIINDVLKMPNGHRILLAGWGLLQRVDEATQYLVLDEVMADPGEVMEAIEAIRHVAESDPQEPIIISNSTDN